MIFKRGGLKINLTPLIAAGGAIIGFLEIPAVCFLSDTYVRA